MIECLVFLFVGILLGAGFMEWRWSREHADGTLKVYIPDVEDEQPYLYVELNEPIWNVCSKKKVMFNVDPQNLKTRK